MRDVTKRVTFLAAMLFCVIMVGASANPNPNANANANASGGRGKVCQSVDIRNNVSSMHEKLQGCEVVEGYVQIVLLDRGRPSDFVNISFPELREITHYLLLYRVQGLQSLGQLFPNLALIRGAVLFEDAALTIFETALLEIGLRDLTHIMAGSVIISKNTSKYEP